MKIYPTKIIKLISTTFVFFLFFSCAKDTDLLTDLAIEEAIVTETIINTDNAITVDEDKAASFNMLNNAAGRSKRRRYKSSKQPTNGGLVIQKDSIAIYTPDFDFNGKDAIEITLEVTNEDNTTSDVTMTVDVTVNPTKDVVDDKYETEQGSQLLMEPLENDNFNENSNVKISQISNASKGSVIKNDDNTLTYTPNLGTAGIDLFTYTTEITNLDQSVTTETGTITVTIGSLDTSSNLTLTLDELKSFPSAFGAGQYTTGGRNGKIYEVTNLNDSGSGSLRAALSASGPRIVLIKVEGRIRLASALNLSSSNQGDVTIIGQTAPGYGLEVTGRRFTFYNNGNIIVRHLTARNGNDTGFGSFGIREAQSGKGAYVDHSTFTYGMDQSLDYIGRFNNQNWTAANNMIAESLEGHNTGSIMGTSGNGSVPTGSYTVARNMWYNVTHRTPNMSGAGGKFEVYNNYIVNHVSRLSRTNGSVKVDYFNNYVDKGKASKSSIPVNKAAYDPGFKTYTGWNFVGGIDETPSDNQTGLWVNYKDNTEGKDNAPIKSSHYVNSRQHYFTEPFDGIWNVMDVPANVTKTVGHNRGTNSNGEPVFLRDALNTSYVSKAISGNVESTFRISSLWTYPSRNSGYQPFLDTDKDGIADSFEDKHGLDKSNASDGLEKKTNWDFGVYKVKNSAGYSNREIYWAYLANDFEIMLGLSEF